MFERIEKKLSNLIKYQFPSVYRDEDNNLFIAFLQAYYEWLEEEGNIVKESRNFFENRDIDETKEEFLLFFQKKYLYGIPFNVIINKTYLLKHVLDVYRTKGTIQCYRLLFKLIYDEEIDVYLPGRDLLRPSDGTWKQPKYIEIVYNEHADELVGKTIVGLVTGTTAVVESFVTETVNKNILSILYLSNILPRGGTFRIGEKVIDIVNVNSDNLKEIIANAPSIIGSLDYIEVINGGLNFNPGDVLKIAQRNINTNEIINNGIDGLVRVTDTGLVRGVVSFNVLNSGSGYMANATTLVYNNPSDTTGHDADFSVGTLLNTQVIRFNTDILANFENVVLNATTWGFPGNVSGNISTPLEDLFTYEEGTFGGILTLSNINAGNGYTHSPTAFVRSTINSLQLTGNVSYNVSSEFVIGDGTSFETYFANNDTIALQANTSDLNTIEMAIIKEVVNDSLIELYGPPINDSTSDAAFRISPNIIEANFAPYEPEYKGTNFTVSGNNANIYAYAAIGNGFITETTAINSGRGYLENELVTLYLYGAINDPTILSPGTGYTNGDIIVCAGGEALTPAQGYVSTNSTGSIIDVTLTYAGAGYISVPNITLRSNTGSGGAVSTTLVEFNPLYEITGVVRKTGIGRSRGQWTTTRGFLNSDKYLQDSYFYQDFSYQIKSGVSFNRYNDILYNTFHISGTELFGEYLISGTNTITLSAIESNVEISTS